jgi:hypothetical protein
MKDVLNLPFLRYLTPLIGTHMGLPTPIFRVGGALLPPDPLKFVKSVDNSKHTYISELAGGVKRVVPTMDQGILYLITTQ